MFQIFARFIEVLDCVRPSHGTRSQTGKLRKYEPHPMCLLPAAANFSKRLVVHTILCLYKPIQIVFIQASTFMMMVRASV